MRKNILKPSMKKQVAEVVAMMSGIPVQRIAQAEGLKLRQMKETLRAKLLVRMKP